jgi:hypothetical protein
MFPSIFPQPFIFPIFDQGLLPIDHLSGLIIFDISVKGGGMASYQVKGLLETWQPDFQLFLDLLSNSVYFQRGVVSCEILD